MFLICPNTVIYGFLCGLVDLRKESFQIDFLFPTECHKNALL